MVNYFTLTFPLRTVCSAIPVAGQRDLSSFLILRSANILYLQRSETRLSCYLIYILLKKKKRKTRPKKSRLLPTGLGKCFSLLSTALAFPKYVCAHNVLCRNLDKFFYIYLYVCMYVPFLQTVML